MAGVARVVRLWLVALAIVIVSAGEASASDEPILEYFWGDGCRFCAAQAVFLDDLSAEFPDLVIESYEVWYDADNQALFREAAFRHGVEATAVPATFFDGRAWVGFNEAIGEQIRGAVASALRGDPDVDDESDVVRVPIIGPVSVGDASLVVATLVIGLVDGFNPCSLWALSILLALVVRTGSRRRLVAVAGTFLLVTVLVYGAFIVGVYGALSVVAHVGWVRVVVALMALAFGIVNLKDYFAFRVGPSLSIPESVKPSLITRMRSVAVSQRGLALTVLATAGLALGVAVMELPCTAGLPVLWSNLLTSAGVDGSTMAFLLGLYLAMYLLDEIILVTVVVVVMRVTKMQERHGQTLKLVTGWLMVTLAIVLVAAPAMMETLSGVGLVVALTIGLTAITLLVRPVSATRDRRQHDSRKPGSRKRPPAHRR